MFALVDGNNFYVSCERAFDPRLERRPVGVLSNNDGCVIARSARSSKRSACKMGTPAFQIRRTLREHRVALLSSNYCLYGDMSRRVNEVLRDRCPGVETYSIDESFADATGVAADAVRPRGVRPRAARRGPAVDGHPVRRGLRPDQDAGEGGQQVREEAPGRDRRQRGGGERRGPPAGAGVAAPWKTSGASAGRGPSGLPPRASAPPWTCP